MVIFQNENILSHEDKEIGKNRITNKYKKLNLQC